ncbi:hypothetical protein LINPERHAP2_LOCUS23362 [Linum perenne]
MMMATASIASTTTKIRVSVARSRATRSPTKDPPPKPDVMSDQDKSLVVRKEINRWCGCRMKVGLTGFRSESDYDNMNKGGKRKFQIYDLEALYDKGNALEKMKRLNGYDDGNLVVDS